MNAARRLAGGIDTTNHHAVMQRPEFHGDFLQFVGLWAASASRACATQQLIEKWSFFAN